MSFNLDLLQNISPNIKNIVLDIDETLVHTIEDHKYRELKKTGIINDNPRLAKYGDRITIFSVEDIVCKKGEGVDSDMWSILRPHLDEFLKFCFEYFDNVIIWSAGLYGYVHAVVDKIFDPLKGIPEPDLIYTRDDCVEKKDGDMIVLTKPLKKIIDENPQLKGITLENTLILDDRTENFIENSKNGLLIPEYNPSPNVKAIARDDIALQQLMYWFLLPSVLKNNDVKKLKKDNIFKKSLNTYLKQIK